MATTTYPDGTPASVNDLQYEILASQWAGDGLIGAVGDTSAVYADSTGRQVKFRAGKHAHIHGHGWTSGSADVIVPVQPNGTSYPRIDLAVLGLDRSATPWRVTEYVKQGTASAAPVAPSLQRDPIGVGTGKWEFPLALIAVGAGVGTLNPADVTPLSVYCGQQNIVMPDLSTLAQIPAPISGTRATVMSASGPLDYVYTASTGWRRADWALPWGYIGGHMYSPGTTLAAGISLYNVTNMDTGPVSVVAGRRYRVEAMFLVQVNTAGAAVGVEIREQDFTGLDRAIWTSFPLSTIYRYSFDLRGEWDETVNASRNYVLAGSVSTGLMSIYRGSLNNRPRVTVFDCGPAGAVTNT